MNVRKWFISYRIPSKESCSHFHISYLCLLMGEGFLFQTGSNFSRILNFFIDLLSLSNYIFLWFSTQNCLQESPFLHCDLNRVLILTYSSSLILKHPRHFSVSTWFHPSLCIQFMNRLTHSLISLLKQTIHIKPSLYSRHEKTWEIRSFLGS